MDLNLVPLGWIHSLACLAALGLGAWVFATPKGTPAHRRLGRAYLIAQLALNLSALGVYRLGVFFFPHVLALITLGLIAVGWLAARLHQPRPVWRYVHLSAMILSYYLLIGGGVNEVYLRIGVLRDYVSVNGGQVIGQTHGLVMLGFLILLLGWNAVELARALLRRRRRGVAAA